MSETARSTHKMKCATRGCKSLAVLPLQYCPACSLRREREVNSLYDRAMDYMRKHKCPFAEAWDAICK